MPRTIEVASESDPDTNYRIGVIGAAKLPYCSCPAWKWHEEPDAKGQKKCKHIRKHWKRVRLMMKGGEKKPRRRKKVNRWVERFCPRHGVVGVLRVLSGNRCLRCNAPTETWEELPEAA